ncbi:MAG TPA: ASPIC/UnbV domain-containing protein [Pyrinomonadaceae bacterium]|nr:ASPIC/UnbV domain-containing protein [Pyrinomonadaceae bacterium]
MGADGAPRYSDVAMAVGADDIRDGRGMATADFDNDGDLDIVVNNNVGDSGREELARAVLLRNDTGARRNWLAVELRGTESNPDAVGAAVTAEAGGVRQLRLVTAGSGYASQHSARLYFGLGEQAQVNSLTVRWPGGRVERFGSFQARQLVRVTEGRGAETLALAGAGGEVARAAVR